MNGAGFDSAGDIANAVTARKRSAVDVIAATLARIEQVDKRLNAFTAVTADRARARAAMIDGAALA
jgi:1-carboxybiuret hydrolase